LSGCDTVPKPKSRQVEREPAPPARPDLAKVQKIELHYCSSGGIPGAPRDDYELDLRAGGPCRLVVTHGNNYNSGNRTTATYALPAATFEEFRRALSDAAFFDMRDSAPEFLFENSGSSVSVTCDGKHTHAVSVTQPAPAPKGYHELVTLVLKADERGELLGTTPPNNPPTPG